MQDVAPDGASADPFPTITWDGLEDLPFPGILTWDGVELTQ